MQTYVSPTLFLLWLASPSPDVCLQYQKKTPLIYAAEKGHLIVVKALLEAGADVNARDKVCLFRIR